MKSKPEREEYRILELAPMRAASVHGFGPEPEMLAWGKLQAWAETKVYLGDSERHRIFGFNNPNPSAGSPNYGYEFWMQLDAVEESNDDAAEVRIISFAGGSYAVTRVEVVGDEYEVIPDGWKRLHGWCEEQGLRFGQHQWFEEHITVPGGDEGFILDLFMPIVK